MVAIESLRDDLDMMRVPLKRIAESQGLIFGSALRLNQLFDVEYARLIEQECAMITPENELKMDALRPGPGIFDFKISDILVNYVLSRGMRVRGHTLLWHHPKWIPNWVRDFDFGSSPAKVALDLVKTHVETVCEHYTARIRSWDVVNEAIDNKTGQLRETSLSRACGSALDVIDAAFHSARRTVPDCNLVYNDYMTWDTPAFQSGVLKLLEGFRKRGTPVDTLGLQSHIAVQPGLLNSGFDAAAERSWRGFLDEVISMGFDLEITEFDVNDSSVLGSYVDRDLATSDVAQAFLECTLSYPAVKTLTVWGLSSKQSWLQRFRNVRADGLPLRCCLYNDNDDQSALRSATAKALAADFSRRRVQ